MIVYFSATGNCKYAAEKIAEATGDRSASITEIDDKIVLTDGESLGIVTPVYFWGLPSYVEDFMDKVTIKNADNSYIYYIATYGTTLGQADYYIKRRLKRKGLSLSASFGIKTVDNWTVWFNVTDGRKIQKELAFEEEQIGLVINAINAKEGVFINKDKMPIFLCTGARLLYERARRTSHLNANDKCTACGLCATGCPVGAIKIADGQPEWTKDKCAICLKCLHRCPQFAIQYDNKTEKHGQYVHP